jgi:hypothetical protein
MMIIGSCGALANGTMIQIMMLVFANILDSFTQDSTLNCDESVTTYVSFNNHHFRNFLEILIS